MRGGGEFDWTDDAVAALRKHYEAGLSAAMIMRALGCPSRNTVIGKVHRLGLSRNLNGGPHICLKSGGPRPSKSVWTDVKLAQFRELYDLRLGDGAIAAALGPPFTRKMVQGKRKNLGLPSHFASPATRRAIRVTRQATRTKLKSDRTIAPYFAPSPPKLRLEPRDAQPIRVTIHELTAESCRWPLGDPSTPEFRYCGAHIDRIGVVSYCAAHVRMAYARAA